MDERIHRLQDRQLLDHADFLGVEYSSLYMCKSKRAVKREESKDAYKLPHRLIEKKRRDRINECIGQLKDLLPEHLKLTTLGHLEKAVVLELTLKHLNTLTAVTEQQHQKIIALQSGDRSMKSAAQTDLDAFHYGFQTCAKEVMQYLNRFENWTARDQRCAQLANHLHKVSTQILPTAQLLSHQLSDGRSAATLQEPDGHKADCQANCVPVIQRTHNGDLNENDTDTDSGYGGEAEKCDGKFDKDFNDEKSRGAKSVKIKQEFEDDHPAKKTKIDLKDTGMGNPDLTNRPDLALLHSLMGLGVVGQQAPFCMPFYFINPSAAASYMPLFDKSILEKYFYPGTASLANPFSLLCSGFPAHSAAVASFPGVPSALSLDKRCESDPLSQNSDTAPLDCVSSNEAELSSPAANEDSFNNEEPDDSSKTENETS
ncbi:hypothetical protein GJAV_G00273640 [Gymnothorax javanicus]|nr:hypothetical protein GJAV_G00273640 [Gymnothorax javanicus]